MNPYRCPRPTRPLDAVVEIPGSKSITNRALVAAALADGVSILRGALLAEDTRLMIDALRALGIAITIDEASCALEVSGCGGHLPADEADLFCGNSGTTLRFLTALCAAGYGTYRLDGTARMRQRPVGSLVDALRALGAKVEFEQQEGFPPLTVHAEHLRGGELRMDASVSSQFVSAMMLAAPCAGDDVLLELLPPVVSRPYLDTTWRVMDAFGVAVIAQPPCAAGVLTGAAGPTPTCHATRDGSAKIIIPAPQRYEARVYPIEPDASNACYFLAAPAVAGGRVTVKGLTRASIQGDAAFTQVLENLGCRVESRADGMTVTGPPAGTKLHSLDIDLNAMPDQAQTLAVLALFADGPTTIRNVANLRVKETDRLAALERELRKLGAHVEEREDGLTILPPAPIRPATIETYDDHRMAMSFALAGLGVEGVVISDPGCCAKTLPEFFAVWDACIRSRNPQRGEGT
ncbi:MAG: 3-phosphoshikimate 1-carboxyvinyltransferase [Phycisphaerales bacterium]|nr:3-phosphoshikimate 1-carboxyvinyltransferase [Phycisphaerales bacterium]